MNKKANVSDELKNIGIAVAVLIIVLIGLALWYLGIFDRIKILLPGFNSTQPVKSDIEIIRYDLSRDNIQWYDSVNFWNFDKNGQTSFNKKTLQKSNIKSDFEDYYYNRDLPIQFVLEKRFNNKIKTINNGAQRVYKNKFLIEKFDNLEKGNVTITVYYATETLLGESPKYFILTLNNELYEINPENREEKEIYKFEYIDEPEKEIISKVNAWKFSILSKPIKINYKENNIGTSNYFCVSFYNPSYLKADLSSPVNSDYKCPITII